MAHHDPPRTPPDAPGAGGDTPEGASGASAQTPGAQAGEGKLIDGTHLFTRAQAGEGERAARGGFPVSTRPSIMAIARSVAAGHPIPPDPRPDPRPLEPWQAELEEDVLLMALAITEAEESAVRATAVAREAALLAQNALRLAHEARVRADKLTRQVQRRLAPGTLPPARRPARRRQRTPPSLPRPSQPTGTTEPAVPVQTMPSPAREGTRDASHGTSG